MINNKIKLKEIKVKSFITKISALQKETVKGGSSIPTTTEKPDIPADTVLTTSEKGNYSANTWT